MSLFGRRASKDADMGASRLPSNLVARLEPFGRFEYDPKGSGVDAIGHPNAEYPLLQLAKQDPDGLLGDLAAATVPIGGWTVYGAMRLAWHFGLLKPESSRDDGDAIGLAALRFIHDAGATWEQLNTDEKALWSRAAGQPW
ncbi:MAG: hypothetical protein ACLPUT_01530 [Solirubrobacteraceae bacterium]